MRSDVEQLIYRLPEAVRPLARDVVRGMGPDDAKNHITNTLGFMMVEKPDTTAYLADRKAARDNAASSAEGSARGRARQYLMRLDSAAGSWKPDYSGKLDRDIFDPRYGTLPKYVRALMRYMTRVTLGVAVAAAFRVDNRGAFVLQRGKAAEWIGTTPRLAGEALALLRRAGLITILHQGSRAQATVYRFARIADVDLGKAARVLQSASKAAAAAVRDRVPA